MIVPMQRSHAEAVARLHADALSDDFLPSLGVNFLRVFYEGALDQRVAFGFVYLQDQVPRGFVLGCLDMHVLFRHVLISRMFALGLAAIPSILRHPLLLRKVAETFLYPSKEDQSPYPAEMVTLGVDATLRGRGIGLALIDEFNRAAREQGVKVYKLTVLQSNQVANSLYQRLGYQLSFDFTLYGKKWNLYTYELEKP